MKRTFVLNKMSGDQTESGWDQYQLLEIQGDLAYLKCWTDDEAFAREMLDAIRWKDSLEEFELQFTKPRATRQAKPRAAKKPVRK